MIFVLSIMLLLGIVQLIWTVFHMLTTENTHVRRHFGYYLVVVLGYFVGLAVFPIIQSVTAGHLDQFWEICHSAYFFLGALGLAVYNILIIATKGQFGKPQPREVTDSMLVNAKIQALMRLEAKEME